MRITPNSVIKLYSTTGIDNINQLAFSTPAKRDEYFERLKIGELRGAQYVRRPGTIRLPLNLSSPEFQSLDFISFQNPDFENTVWYAQVQNWTYINNETTEVQYIINPLLTFMGRFVMKPCTIERQQLSVEEKEKADINPYDASIYPLWTEEDLPVDVSMEKYTYSVGDRNTDDGKFMFSEPSSYNDKLSQDLGGNTLGVFFIAPIDFTDLDANASDPLDTPSMQWSALINQIINAGGYYVDPESTQAAYPNNTFMMLSFMPRPYMILAIKNFASSGNAGGLVLFNDVIEKLTIWNATSQIIGIYGIEENMFKTAFVDTGSTSGTVTPGTLKGTVVEFPTAYKRKQSGYTTSSPTAHKLYRFPYAYMRVVTPDGNKKEYQYENFSKVARPMVENPVDTCKFRLVCDLNCSPSFFAAPLYYKQTIQEYSPAGGDPSGVATVDEQRNANLNERIEYNNFQQIPFSTDGYLAYQASLASQIVGSFTHHAENQQKRTAVETVVGGLGDILVQGVTTGLGGLASGASIAASVASGASAPAVAAKTFNAASSEVKNSGGLVNAIWGFIKNYEDVKYEAEEISAAQEWYSKAASMDNPNMKWLGNVRRAYANDQYYPGTNEAPYNYLKLFPAPNFILFHVQLRDDVLKAYDEYFCKYGYNQGGLVDIPHIYNFISGLATNYPENTTWVGTSLYFGFADTSYVKTQDAFVTGIPRVYADAIQNMFNNGIRFINGDQALANLQAQEENNG